MKTILLSILLLIMSCSAPKAPTKETKVEEEIKVEEIIEIPEVVNEEIIVVLKDPSKVDDVKQLIENNGLIWDKLIFDQEDSKIALLKVPADKRAFWMENLKNSGEFKSVELNKEITLNKIIAEIKSPLVTLRKTPCYGHCPEFNVSITKKGNVTYRGIKNVLVKGKRTFKLTDNQFTKLKKMLDKTSFSKYRNTYNNANIKDLPSTYISHNNKEIQMRVWGKVPTELVQVTEYIEDILLAQKFYEL